MPALPPVARADAHPPPVHAEVLTHWANPPAIGAARAPLQRECTGPWRATAFAIDRVPEHPSPDRSIALPVAVAHWVGFYVFYK